MRKVAGEKFVSLPSGRLISHKTQVPYLGIILSYQDYEMRTLTHRLKASKAAMAEVAHAVRNHRVLSECRRKSIWTITAWASALYSLHVVGVTQAGLNRLQIPYGLSATLCTAELLPGDEGNQPGSCSGGPEFSRHSSSYRNALRSS